MRNPTSIPRRKAKRKSNSFSTVIVIGLLLLAFNIIAFRSVRSRPRSDEEWTTSCRTTPPSSSRQESSPPIKGVFVIKAAKAEHVAKTLCSLTHFFNARYPVRIFVDTVDVDDDVLKTLQTFAGNGTDLKVIPDPTQKWTRLPSHFNATQRKLVLQQCQEFDTHPERARCTTMKFPLGYVYMNYWNYAIMPYEPELQQFDYILSLDADAFLTQPWSSVDPFELMDRHRLTGVYDIQAFQSGDIAMGIQESVSELFEKSKRRNKSLDILPWFDANGYWQSLSPNGGMRPSVWTHFWGVRRDFFDSALYKQFAEKMAFYTYLYRTDEQPVIGAAWALLANDSANDIWYLPARGIQLGVYHHGWVDNREVIKLDKKEDDERHYAVNTLHEWPRFTEHPTQLLSWEEYLRLSGNDVGWDLCATATTK